MTLSFPVLETSRPQVPTYIGVAMLLGIFASSKWTDGLRALAWVNPSEEVLVQQAQEGTLRKAPREDPPDVPGSREALAWGPLPRYIILMVVVGRAQLFGIKLGKCNGTFRCKVQGHELDAKVCLQRPIGLCQVWKPLSLSKQTEKGGKKSLSQMSVTNRVFISNTSGPRSYSESCGWFWNDLGRTRWSCVELCFLEKGREDPCRVNKDGYHFILCLSTPVCLLHENSIFIQCRAFKKLKKLCWRGEKPSGPAEKLQEYCPGLSYFSYRVTCCLHFAIFLLWLLFLSLSIDKIGWYEIYTLFIPFLFLLNIWE